MKSFNQTLGITIKKYRIDRRLTQRELADLLQKDRSLISYYEQGKRPMTMDTFNSICKIMNLDSSDVFVEVCKYYDSQK